MESSLPYGVISQGQPGGRHIRKAMNVYLLLPYRVLGDKLQGGEIGHPPLP